MTTNLTPELQKQIEQEAKSSAANFCYHPGSSENEDFESAYITGANKYAALWQAAEARAGRYEKALKAILNTNHDNHERVILKVKQLANEALTPKPITNE